MVSILESKMAAKIQFYTKKMLERLQTASKTLNVQNIQLKMAWRFFLNRNISTPNGL